jgi:4-hydroxy-3-methylbut-2-enyl diphosphate reductase
MTHLLICAALGIEARALRRGLPADLAGVTLIRTGPGPDRAEHAAALLPAAGALAVAGFGGALQEGLRPGDVLVASEVRFGDRIWPCPSAQFLAGELARAGMSARLGPLLTCDHLVRAGERRRLSRTGALAVDMETGPLARAATGRPFAAVRVIVDGPGRPLASPATVPAALAARRTLRRLGPALVRWSAAAGPRTLEVRH